MVEAQRRPPVTIRLIDRIPEGYKIRSSVWQLFKVRIYFFIPSGGLRFAATTGYYLAALQTACTLPTAHCRY